MWELKAGDILGDKYNIIEKIGQGGFGVVYKVLDSDKLVKALKAIRPDIVLSDEIKYRYIKEAEIWIELEWHPFIVSAHVIEKIDNRIFIVTEYIEPGTNGLNSLESYLSINKSDLRQTLIWAIQFCLGIEYAYSKKIKAHRDIKPSNIMIDKLGNVRINDFGLAGIIRASEVMNMHNLEPDTYAKTHIGIGIGTPSYMSPEQFVDVAGCDQRSDIYSFGVVLYQLISGGGLPFDSQNKGQYWQIMKHQHETSSIPTLNSLLFPQIKQCMEKRPCDRIQSFTELRAELENHLWNLYKEKVNCKLQNPSPIEALVNKGVSLASLGKYLEAIDCYDKALNFNPTDKKVISIIFNNKAVSMKSLNRLEEALELYDKSISIREYELLLRQQNR